MAKRFSGLCWTKNVGRVTLMDEKRIALERMMRNPLLDRNSIRTKWLNEANQFRSAAKTSLIYSCLKIRAEFKQQFVCIPPGGHMRRPSLCSALRTCLWTETLVATFVPCCTGICDPTGSALYGACEPNLCITNANTFSILGVERRYRCDVSAPSS